MGLEVAVLGPVECRVGGRVISIGSTKQRAILAVLALETPRVVPAERLIEALWGDDPPAAARNSLESHVSRLRKLLAESGEALRTQTPGYALDAETDLQEFGRLRNAGDPVGALQLWRGSALADLADEPFADP